MHRYEESKKSLLEVHDDVDLSILRAAQVVGMTTSGVADKQTLIAALAPKVHIHCQNNSYFPDGDCLAKPPAKITNVPIFFPSIHQVFTIRNVCATLFPHLHGTALSRNVSRASSCGQGWACEATFALGAVAQAPFRPLLHTIC